MAALIITGAASGIGRAVARLAAQDRPALQLVLVDRDLRGLERLAEELASERHIIVAGDLADPAFPDEIVRHAIGAFGSLVGLVSNAGIIGSELLSDLTVEAFDREMAVNVRATWLLARAAYPHLSASKGALVATASMAATVPAPGLGVYTPSKAALVALIRQLAVEWGADGIRCNTVSPGPTRTAITERAYAVAEALTARERAVPMGRVADPNDIAQVIMFLLDDTSRFVTGVDVVADGGLSLNLMRVAGAAGDLKS